MQDRSGLNVEILESSLHEGSRSDGVFEDKGMPESKSWRNALTEKRGQREVIETAIKPKVKRM